MTMIGTPLPSKAVIFAIAIGLLTILALPIALIAWVLA